MIYPQNPPGTSKRKEEGIVKNHPGTLNNQKIPSETMKNQPGTLKNYKKTAWNHEKLTLNLKKPT